MSEENTESASNKSDPSAKDGAVDGAKNTKGGMGKKAAGAAFGSTEAGRKVQDGVQKVKRAQQLWNSALSFIKSISSLLVNPVFWTIVGIVAALLLIIATIIASVNTIGRNENADGCIPSDSGGSGVSVVSSEDLTENLNSFATWMMSTDFDIIGGSMSLEQAAGVIGNITQESKGDPKATQGGWASASMSNEEMMAVSGSGKAIGLAQWDGGRRTALARFAKEHDGHWSDLQIQLEYFRQEIAGGTYEGDLLQRRGFTEQGRTVEFYVESFEKAFERAGSPNYPARHTSAKTFIDNFGGGYTADTGGSCMTAISGGAYQGEIAELAVLLSWPLGEKDRSRTHGDPGGRDKAKPEYIEAKAEAEALTSKDPQPLFASCDRFVATVVKNTVDPDIPWGSTANQYQYLRDSPKWEEYKDPRERQPGDIWVAAKGSDPGVQFGHIIILAGEQNGREIIAHASYGQRTAAIDYLDDIYDGMQDRALRRQHTGYRFVG